MLSLFSKGGSQFFSPSLSFFLFLSFLSAHSRVFSSILFLPMTKRPRRALIARSFAFRTKRHATVAFQPTFVPPWEADRDRKKVGREVILRGTVRQQWRTSVFLWIPRVELSTTDRASLSFNPFFGVAKNRVWISFWELLSREFWKFFIGFVRSN